MTDEFTHDNSDNRAEDKNNFRRYYADRTQQENAGEERNFVRPLRPSAQRPVTEANPFAPPRSATGVARPVRDIQQRQDKSNTEADAGSEAVSYTRKLRPIEMPPELSAPQTASKPVTDETRRQTPVKPLKQAETVKVSADVPAGNLSGGKRGETPVKVSSRNRNAAEMESIFRKEARFTEIPGGRSYPGFLFRLKRNGPSKLYRLKGYANQEYVKQQRKHSQKLFKRANIFFWIVVFILFLIIFYWLDPIDKIQEIMHLFGM